MMPTLSSLLILSPNGAVGAALCQAILPHRSQFTRIAVFNNTNRPTTPSKEAVFTRLSDQGFEIVSGAYTTVSVFTGFDTVVMPLGNHGMYLQPQIIDTAIEAGVRHFYPSEWGADLSIGDNLKQRYYKDKAVTRSHLAKRARDVKGLGWTLVQVGRFTEYSVHKALGIDNPNHEAGVYGNEEGRQSLMCIADVIAYTVQTLLDPSVGAGERNLRFHGESPTWRELFAALERITGSKYNVTYFDVGEAKAKERRALELADVELELEASHQLIQGGGGTLLREPFDNARYPEVVPRGFEESLRLAFDNKLMRRLAYGL